MRIPVLGMDDEIITELPAIMTAISQLAPQFDMLGSNDMEIVRSYEWLNWLSGTLHGQAFGAFWRPQRFTDNPELHNSLKMHALVTIQDCFSDIEGKVTGTHSVGNSFTAVDAFLLVFWLWGKKIGIDMEKNYSRYSNLASAVLNRESTKAAMEAERVASKM
jgi:glutathione S-transferase